MRFEFPSMNLAHTLFCLGLKTWYTMVPASRVTKHSFRFVYRSSILYTSLLQHYTHSHAYRLLQSQPHLIEIRGQKFDRGVEILYKVLPHHNDHCLRGGEYHCRILHENVRVEQSRPWCRAVGKAHLLHNMRSFLIPFLLTSPRYDM